MSTQRGGDPFADWLGGLSERLSDDRWQPAADVYETEKAIEVRLDLAGVASSDLEVRVDRDVLRIRGVRKARMDADTHRLHQMEIAFGPFERTLRIGVPFEREGVTARLEDGFLRVTLLKRQRRSIPVQREAAAREDES